MESEKGTVQTAYDNGHAKGFDWLIPKLCDALPNGGPYFESIHSPWMVVYSSGNYPSYWRVTLKNFGHSYNFSLCFGGYRTLWFNAIDCSYKMYLGSATNAHELYICEGLFSTCDPDIDKHNLDGSNVAMSVLHSHRRKLLYDNSLRLRLELVVEEKVSTTTTVAVPRTLMLPGICFEFDLWKSLMTDDTFADVNIMCSDSDYSIMAHRCVLASASPVFRQMFLTEMKEGKTGCVYVEDVSYQCLKILIRYIYTGEFNHLPTAVTELKNLVYASEKYAIEKLKQVALVKLVKENLNSVNAKELLNFADMYNASKDVIDFIKKLM